MADRPIIFSGPMIRALLDGRKTQTRRLATSPLAKCQPGDRLWVREGWAVPENFGSRSASKLAKSCLDAGYPQPWAPIHFLADSSRENWGEWREAAPGKGRPSIHMPRWASRLTLVVEQVRIQALQEITNEDALQEGVGWALSADIPAVGQAMAAGSTRRHRTDGFAALWDSLHGTKPGEAWGDNPQVVALTFTVHRSNIDRMGADHG